MATKKDAVHLYYEQLAAQPGDTWENCSQEFASVQAGAVVVDEGGTFCGGGTAADPVVFLGNTAVFQGAAVTMRPGSELELTQVLFTENASEQGGGALFSYRQTELSGATFSNNYSAAGGGAVNQGGGTFTGADLIFSGNSAAGSGGAFTCTSVGTVIDIRDAVFSGNHAAGWGGAVNISGGTLNLTGTTFSGNSGSEGGAVSISGSPVVTVKDSLFTGNTSTYGSAIVQYGGELRIGGSTFAGNSGPGGVIGLIGGTMVITDTITLVTNSLFGKGCSISWDNFAGRACYRIFDADTSADQWSGTGLGSAETEEFKAVTVAEDLYIQSKDAKYDFSNAIFSADGSVTEVVVAGETVAGIGYKFDEVKAAAAFGAVRYVFVNPVLTQRTEINQSAGLTYDYLNLTASGLVSSGNGGALSVAGGCTVTINGGLFADNSTTGWGGAVCCTGNLSLSGVTFSGNSIAGEGGAILLSGDNSLLTVKNTLFTGNKASWGGGIVMYAGQLRIGGSTFSGNSGAGGSAICRSGGSVVITDTITLVGDVVGGGSYGIDIAGLDAAAYYKVFDADTSANQWAGSGLGTYETEAFQAVTVAEDLYLKSKNAKYDFTNAIFSADGSVSSVVISGETISGVGYTFADETVALGFGAERLIYTGVTLTEHLDVPTNGKEYIYAGITADGILSSGGVRGALYLGSGGTAVIDGGLFTDNINTGWGGAVYNQGTLQISGTTFSGNAGSEGGAILQYSGGVMEVKNVLFTGNTASSGWGSAIMQYAGTIRIGGATFSGNNGTAFLVYGGGNAVITDTITLAAPGDVLGVNSGGSFSIDIAGFDGNPYYRVIDAAGTAAQWSSTGLGSVETETFKAVTVKEDLYIQSKDAKYDFSKAILSADGSVSSVVIGGETISGMAYKFTEADLAAAFGAERLIFVDPVLTGHLETVAGAEYDFLNITAAGIVSDTYGAALLGVSGSTTAVDGGLFAGNTTSAYGGALACNGLMTVSGATFSGNCAGEGGAVLVTISSADLTFNNTLFTGNTAGYGSAVVQYDGLLTVKGSTFSGNHGAGAAVAVINGTLRIGGTTFDGNDGYAVMVYDSSVAVITDTITLTKNGDVMYIEKGGTYTIDIDGFADEAYHKVISAAAAEQWTGTNLGTAETEAFRAATVGTDLYIQSKDAKYDFTTAVISDGGTIAQTVIAGESFSGVAYRRGDEAAASVFGASRFAVDSIVTVSDYTVSLASVSGDALVAVKDSVIGGNYYSFGNSLSVDGNVTLLVENFRSAGAVYAAGSAAVSGDILVQVTGSTIGTNLSTTSSSSLISGGNMTTEVTGSLILGTLRATGSSGNITVQDVAVTVTDSYAGEILAAYGNTVSGDAVITLAGATVGVDIRRFASSKQNTIAGEVSLQITGETITAVAGSVLGMDVITVAAGAELNCGGGIACSGSFVNRGSVCVGADSQLQFNTGSKLGSLTVNDSTLTINVNRIASGTTYEEVTLNGKSGLNVTGTGFAVAGRVFYYCVVDAALTGEFGQEVTVTVDGEQTQAIYGVNAFTTSEAAKLAAPGAQIVVVDEVFAKNYYGGGSTKISGGRVALTTYGGKLVKESGAAGDSDLAITGGTFASMIVGGHRVSVDSGKSAAVTAGTASLAVSGGTFGNTHFIAAGYVINNGEGASLEVTESNLMLADISTDKYAVGGAFVNGGTASVGTVNAAVTSGTYKSVFGGGWAQKGSSSVGTANLTVSGGSIHNLYAGGTDNGDGNAATVGTANITISNGTVRNVFLNGKYSRDTVNAATLNVTGACEINWIEGLCHSMVASSKETKTALNIGADLTVEDILHVDEWNFNTVGTLLDFGTHTADLDGTTEAAVDTVIDFQIGKQDIGEGWTAVAAQKFEGLKQSSVEINGQAASEYAAETNTWTFDTDYTVTLGQYNDTRKALIVTKYTA